MFLKKISKYILRYEIHHLENTNKILSNRNIALNEEISTLYSKIKKDKKDKDRLLKIVNERKGSNCSLAITSKNEIVFIFKEKNLENTLYLYGLESDYHRIDCILYYKLYDTSVKITNLVSYNAGKGYAKTIMIHFIKKMREQKITKIYGDLAYTSKDIFDWLIPFYESLGFTCTLPVDIRKNNGSITMYLSYD